MEDPEESREIPRTWRDYLAATKESFGVFRWVIKELSTDSHNFWLKMFITALVISSVFSAVEPWLMSYVFNGLIDRNSGLLIFGLGGVAFCYICGRVTEYCKAIAREYLLGIDWGRLDERITELFFEKPMGQHIRESSSLNVANIDKGRWKALDLNKLLIFDGIPMLFSLLFSYAALWFFSAVAGTIMTIIIAVYIVYMFFINRRIVEICIPIDAELRKMNRHRVERWEKVERVKVCGKENEELSLMTKWFDEVIDKDRNFWLWENKQCMYRGLFNIAGHMMIISYGAYMVWSGDWTIGSFYPLCIWVGRMAENIWKIGDIEHQFNWNMPSVRAKIKALTVKPDFLAESSVSDIVGREISIEFRNVVHTYPIGNGEENGNNHSSKPGLPVVNKVSFTVGAGDKVALIGPSGAGKTTIGRLLLRYMDPDDGNIYVNGSDLRDVTLKSWMDCVGYIAQQPQIYDGTIRYNLTYALEPEKKSVITDDKLWELMRLLKIDFAGRLTSGLDTLVGRNGIKLSGGESQRLMIGAAAIKKPRFMIIDEATSSLDSSTEKAVQAGLAAVLEGQVSALIIAHRLSTVRKLCNKFIVLKNSEDVENGGSQIETIANSFEELYKISPTFRQLADDQEIVI